jgi:hypothetical protein
MPRLGGSRKQQVFAKNIVTGIASDVLDTGPTAFFAPHVAMLWTKAISQVE